ncbi:MAG: hypothetical protein K8I60_11540 [Anaerolineae bacterium]|nr:hypothetical protein [Anaerolineae bacterium]
METLPQLVPLVVFIPLVGMIVNLLWGARLGERWAGLIGSGAAILSFLVSLLLLNYLTGSNYQPAVVNPPFLDGWLRIGSINLEIPWQQRVDTLSVTMMLVVTGVGSLIHIYATGYMHGDERFSRFFAYLNLFLVFMLILVTGNNFLMMFVGWEGVGLCSYLLIGFWFDKARGVGWRNSLAARKAMILNRIGDFGMLMAIFLIFWTFGTLDYYKPGEVTNVEYQEHLISQLTGEAAPAEGEHAAPAEGEQTAPAAEGEHAATTAETPAEGEAAAAEGEHTGVAIPEYANNEHLRTEQLGVFGQAQRLLDENVQIALGPVTLPIQTVIVLITLFLLLGATGKSAQIPLFVWLPDAMAGPTPVSALIHAATMVTAGVYMMVRSNVFYHNAELTSFVVALIGGLTALAAGYIAMGQWDIKRVLAYSTISQLGFMVAAVGIGAYGAAMFHLVTHAFFKALLFLGSGSVIHGVEHGHHNAHEAHGHGHGHDDHHHEEEEFDPQDMRNMGGLRNKMPITFLTYLFGTLALAGIWPFAGFWSKDEILGDSWTAGLYSKTLLPQLAGYIVFALLLVAAAFTAFYMWRQIQMVFFGKPRTAAAEHAPESVPAMLWPLVILAFFSLFAGFYNVPANGGAFTLFGLFENLFGGAHSFTLFLEPSVAYAHAGDLQGGIALLALSLAAVAIYTAWRIYGGEKAVTAEHTDPLYANRATRRIWSLANARLYWDETYNLLFERPFNATGNFLAHTLDWTFWHDYFHENVVARGFNAIGELLSKPVDLGLVDGIVNGVGWVVRWVSGGLRRVQTGYVRTYAITLLLGVVLVILILLLPMLQSGS